MAEKAASSVLTAGELAERSVRCEKGVMVWREGAHVAVKGMGAPPVYIGPADLPRVAALIALPTLPADCAHGRAPGDCPQCGKPAGPA